MDSIVEFRGMIAPVFCPFTLDGELNLEAIPAYASYLISQGVKGVYVNGTNGEGMSLTVEERKKVAEAWMQQKGLVTVVMVGAGNMRDVGELAQHAEIIGASGIASLPILYDKPKTLEELVEFCRRVAAKAPRTPFLYYHFPQRTGVDFLMSEFLTFGKEKIPTLAGIKFTSLDPEDDLAKCLQVARGKMKIFTGFDQTLSDRLGRGVDCAITAGCNFVPQFNKRIFDIFHTNQDLTEAEEVQDKINAVLTTVEENCFGHLIGGFKAAMKILTGIDVGPTRFPVIYPSLESQNKMAASFKSCGITIARDL